MLSKYITILIILSTINTSSSQVFCPNEEIQQIGQSSKCFIEFDTNRPTSCLEPILPNTLVIISCKYNYQIGKGNNHVYCQDNGNWNETALRCNDICAGTSSTEFDDLVGNRNEEAERSPWVVGIHSIDPDNKDKIDPNPVCGGVLLHSKIVLSHPECLEKHDGRSSKLGVVAGKFDGRISLPNSQYQFSRFKTIFIGGLHPVKSGLYGNTRLAVIELTDYFIYNQFVKPACIDWDLLSNKSQSLDKVGLLPVWGDIDNCLLVKNKKRLNTLQMKNFTDYSGCTEPQENLAEGQSAEKYTEDTFCYKYDSTPEVVDANCYGLSGSGMFLKRENENEEKKNILWAIVHNTEILDLRNSRKRYIKSFIDLLPQKNFILHNLFKFRNEVVISKEYLRKPCKLDFQEHVFKTSEVTCYLHGDLIPCQRETQTNTIVRSKCIFGYARSTGNDTDEKTCLEAGKWSNQLVDCIKICGTISPSKTIGLVFGGKTTDIENVPWHVGIYANNVAKSKGKFIQICGGTIVRSNIVISAAHCFWNSNLNQANDKNVYAVAAGKHYRNFHASERQRVQFSTLKDLVIPKTYNQLFYRNDIAILVLVKPLVYNSYTKPACLILLQAGNYNIDGNVKGLVSGWGAATELSESTNELRSIEIVTLTNENCKELIDSNSRSEITGEKFCAKGKDGETACRGDSGGGFLVPQIEEDGIKHYYLWAVVSSGLDATTHCTAKFFSTYTNVQYHQDIINLVISNNTLL